MADPAPPMWTCPRCEHRFVTANIWHSCTVRTLDDAFARTTPDARTAFERFVELPAGCGRRVEAPWVQRIEAYGPHWNAHRFVARSKADVDAIAKLPALLCEGYRDLGMQGWRRSGRADT